MKRWGITARRLLAVAGVAVIAATVTLVELPFVQHRPGHAVPVSAYVLVDRSRIASDVPIDPVNGQLLLTTVRSRQPTIAEILAGWFDPDDQITAIQDALPDGLTYDQARRRNIRRFHGSTSTAVAAAQWAAERNEEMPASVDETELAVHFVDDDIGGTSAGLMMALTIYDQLSPNDLAQGRVIAGTGTIDRRGRVGRIGYIEMKVHAALAADAEIFLAPTDQASRARRAADARLQVVGVTELDEALRILQASPGSIAGPRPPPRFRTRHRPAAAD